MMKLRVVLGKIDLLKGRQPQPPSRKCLSGKSENEKADFSEIRLEAE